MVIEVSLIHADKAEHSISGSARPLRSPGKAVVGLYC